MYRIRVSRMYWYYCNCHDGVWRTIDLLCNFVLTVKSVDCVRIYIKHVLPTAFRVFDNGSTLIFIFIEGRSRFLARARNGKIKARKKRADQESCWKTCGSITLQGNCPTAFGKQIFPALCNNLSKSS